MKFAALISGGKDSLYCVMQCISAGHDLIALANLAPCGKDELDSYMFQTVGHMGISSISEAMGIPLFKKEIQGRPINIERLDYEYTVEDEVEDLFLLLKEVKEACGIEAISCGAILSNYQRNRVENVCSRLGLVSFSYLWQRNQVELLDEMIESGMEVMIIKVAALGLEPHKHLGKTIKQMKPHLLAMQHKFCLNVCGEGGEYETFTLDCPIFKKKIVIDEFEIVETSGDVGYLNFKSISFKEKPQERFSLCELVEKAGIKSPRSYCKDMMLQYHLFDSDELVMENIPLQCYEESSNLVRVIGYADNMVNAIEDIKYQLETKSRNLRDVIYMKLYVKNMKDYQIYNTDYIKFFSSNPPARCCAQVEMLTSNICIEALASDSVKKEHIHIQSISHWAPASIGPYSQGIRIGQIIMIAGMIGLIPGDMKLIEEDSQANLSFACINQVVSAFVGKSDIQNIIQAVCYVTSRDAIPAAKSVVSNTPHLIATYVIVPALPKNALVEWQTWGHCLNMNIFITYEKTATIGNYKVFMRQRYSKFTNVSAASIDISSFEDVLPTVEDINVIVKEINDNISTKSTKNLTVFYRLDKINVALLENNLKLDNCNEPFLIPIQGLEDEINLISFVIATY